MTEQNKKWDDRFKNEIIPVVIQMGARPDQTEAKAMVRNYIAASSKPFIWTGLAHTFFMAPLVFALVGMFNVFFGLLAMLVPLYFAYRAFSRYFAFKAGKEVKYYESRLDMIREGTLGSDGEPV
ncbi:hypothetical protein [Thioalkalivibrio sp. ALE16]|uniref:hypothetical protein n=1 Tax=Thioalkalivibrio sp. ALE16 TaxID=1158172 RepID=UPI000374B5F4|nr:hypothetical protein [Thioalkalivibrio sp. ALE16]